MPLGAARAARSADRLKIDMWENPSFDSSGSRQLVGTLRCALSLSSHLHYYQEYIRTYALLLLLTFESRLPLLCMHIVRHATESEVHASGKFCSISDPPPPPPPSLSLSLSPCDQIREKESLPLNTTIRASKGKCAKCGHQVQVFRAPTASMQWLIQKKKCRAFSCNVKLCSWCFVNFDRPQTRSRLGQLHAEWCNF